MPVIPAWGRDGDRKILKSTAGMERMGTGTLRCILKQIRLLAYYSVNSVDLEASMVKVCFNISHGSGSNTSVSGVCVWEMWSKGKKMDSLPEWLIYEITQRRRQLLVTYSFVWPELPTVESQLQGEGSMLRCPGWGIFFTSVDFENEFEIARMIFRASWQLSIATSLLRHRINLCLLHILF